MRLSNQHFLITSSHHQTAPESSQPDARDLRLPRLFGHPPRVQRPRQGHRRLVLHGRGGRADDPAGRRQRGSQRLVHGAVQSQRRAAQGPRRQQRSAAAEGLDPTEVRRQGLVSTWRGSRWCWCWAATPATAAAAAASADQGQDSGQDFGSCASSCCTPVRSARFWCCPTCSSSCHDGSGSRFLGCLWWWWWCHL